MHTCTDIDEEQADWRSVRRTYNVWICTQACSTYVRAMKDHKQKKAARALACLQAGRRVSATSLLFRAMCKMPFQAFSSSNASEAQIKRSAVAMYFLYVRTLLFFLKPPHAMNVRTQYLDLLYVRTVVQYCLYDTISTYNGYLTWWYTVDDRRMIYIFN